jgi:hypothetical protein
VSERPAGAEFLLLVFEPGVAPAVAVPLEPVPALLVEPGVAPAVAVPLEPVPALLVEPGVAPAVAVPLERAVPDNEREDDEGDGLGHKLSYTNCSGAPLQAVADPALNVPFG